MPALISTLVLVPLLTLLHAALAKHRAIRCSVMSGLVIGMLLIALSSKF